MSKRFVSAIMLALTLAGLALASCGGGGQGGIPLDDRGDCAKRTFPQCGLGGPN